MDARDGGLSSFVTALQRWASERSTARAVTFLADGEAEAGTLTFGELGIRSARVSEKLIALGAAGKPALLLCTSGLDFVVAFCGCLCAGVIAVPVPFSPRRRSRERIEAIAADACPAVVVGAPAMADITNELNLPDTPRLWIDMDEPAIGLQTPLRNVVDAASPAFIQYTSGSTGSPKGVVVTHRNLAANLEMFRAGFGVHADSRFVCWLPLFHDMGLIGHLLAALYFGVPCVFMPPLSFLQKPERWLRAISRYRATISGAPNFAFELCARRVEQMQRRGLDLSAWETAFCGAEPVRAATMRNFGRAFAPFGLSGSALHPCYGLAEATLFVTATPHGQAIKCLSRDGEPTGPPVVSCGRPSPGETIRIVDPETKVPVADGESGEIWVSGDHIAEGYWRNPVESRLVFGAGIAPDAAGPFLRTGDLGIMWDGELYVTGRLKDLIIYRGLNIHPSDMEATVARCHPALGETGAAFSIDVAGEEQVVVVHEVVRQYLRDLDADEVAGKVIEAIAEAHALRLYDFVLVRPGAVSRTTSGKVQRSRCRTMYLSGMLQPVQPTRHRSLGRNQSPGAQAS